MTNEEYYDLLKTHYSVSNVNSEDRLNTISELQESTSEDLSTNYISEYDLKIGMVEFKKDITINFLTLLTVVLKQDNYKEIVYNSISKTVLCQMKALKLGDYVTVNEDDINNIYIVRAKPFRKRNYDEVFILECLNDVKILDDDGVTIYNYPISVQDNKSRPGVNERADSGVTDSSTFQAYVKYDSISRRFVDTTNGKSNKITRILIDGIAYRIVGDDAISMGYEHTGLITLGLEKDTVTSNDNLELGIADYYNNLPQPTPTSEITCEYPDLCIGETNTYTIVTNNTVTWG